LGNINNERAYPGACDEALLHLKEALRLRPDDAETKQLLSALEAQPAAK
jgi:hypothetical protein